MKIYIQDNRLQFVLVLVSKKVDQKNFNNDTLEKGILSFCHFCFYFSPINDHVNEWEVGLRLYKRNQ
jgi:hypothetical protein